MILLSKISFDSLNCCLCSLSENKFGNFANFEWMYINLEETVLKKNLWSIPSKPESLGLTQISKNIKAPNIKFPSTKIVKMIIR